MTGLKDLRGWLPKRRPDAHKGDFGHVLIVAGSRGMAGAAILAARGALRSGAGLTTLAIPESQQGTAAAAVPEAMTLGLPETSGGTLRGDAVGRIQAAHMKHAYTVLAVGPGLTTNAETARAVIGLLGSFPLPAVLDADALNILALQSQSEVRRLFDRRKFPHIVTPHPGEAARLLRTKTALLSKDRVASAKLMSSQLACVCLLKGRKTVVASGDRVYVNATGNPGLAKGGSGDVLTGVIAAVWAQRLKTESYGDTGFEAACLSAYLHGFAADHVVKEKTTRCLIATDVAEALPKAFKKLGL